MHIDETQWTDFDTTIVGGGPVGMGLAIELGQRGVSVALIERNEMPQRIPKGQNLTQRTMEHFHFWGAESQLREARTIPPEYGIGGLTAYGTLLGPYCYDWLQRDLVRPYYFKANERLPQYATEAVLRERLLELPGVKVFYGWKAQRVDSDEDFAYVDAASNDGASRCGCRSRYVVGCDGSRSLVRAQAGISQTQSDHDRMMVLLVFRSPQLHELLKRFPGKSYYNVLQPELEGYWKFFGRVDLGQTWFFHAPVPRGTTPDNFDFKRYLQEAVGADFAVEFEHIGFWDLRFAISDRYRTGRMFIAGDAAHSHPPYGGYGVNTGFEDARNLGWKLAAVLSGWGEEALLDSYDAERRPVFESTARDFIAKAIQTDKTFLEQFSPTRDRLAFEQAWKDRSSGAVSEVQSFEPNYEGSPVVAASASRQDRVPSAVGSHSFLARAGHHLAPAQLSSGHNVFDQLGEGFTLLAFGAMHSDLEAFEHAALAAGVPMTVITDTADDERARYMASLILVRPDHFVAWTNRESPADVDQILRIVRGASAANTDVA